MPSSFELPQHRETYDSFGETCGGVQDLNAVLQQMREGRREYVGPADADLDLSYQMPFPAAVLWQYFVDTDKRLRWQLVQTAVENQPNDRGRMGVGAASHCAHGAAGDALREYLDWRPFSYVTNRFTPLPGAVLMPRSIETSEFIPLERDGGTEIHWRIKLEDRDEEAVRQFETTANLLRGMTAAMKGGLSKVLDEDGFVPGHSDDASDAMEP